MRAWYLIHSKPQRERVALDNLQRQGYESYLPLLRNRRRVAGRHAVRIEPLFPRYLFVRLSDESDDWGPIRSTLGVSRLVRFGLRPARIPDDMIAMLKDREDGDGIQQLTPPCLEPGDRVRVIEGVMADYGSIDLAHRQGAGGDTARHR